jgi:hypothetical protein
MTRSLVDLIASNFILRFELFLRHKTPFNIMSRVGGQSNNTWRETIITSSPPAISRISNVEIGQVPGNSVLARTKGQKRKTPASYGKSREEEQYIFYLILKIIRWSRVSPNARLSRKQQTDIPKSTAFKGEPSFDKLVPQSPSTEPGVEIGYAANEEPEHVSPKKMQKRKEPDADETFEEDQ